MHLGHHRRLTGRVATRKLLLHWLPEDFYCTLLSIDLLFPRGNEDKIMLFNNGKKEGQENFSIFWELCSKSGMRVRRNQRRWKGSMKALFSLKSNMLR